MEGAIGSPRWLHLSATQRTRLEGLENQFRPFFPGSDQGLSLRTTLLAELRFDPVALGIELADMRLYLADGDAPLNNTLINPLDILQLYLGARLRNAFAEGASLSLRAGRQTLDLGGRRLVARNRFRNAINAFTGLDLQWTGPRRDEARAFATVPVRRRPDLLDALTDNEGQSDKELTGTRLWGLFYGSRPWAGLLRAELYLLGIREEDEEDWLTRDRDLLTPGLRIYREPAPGRLDFEVELVYQSGTSRYTVLPEDTTGLRHRAFFVHGSAARTFSGRWRPRLVLQYDHASGDQDPLDGEMNAFDTLYGARRFELGPTGLYGAFGRSNIITPGLRLEMQLHPRVEAFLAYRPAWLASSRDSWSTTLIWDPTGRSGTFLGHQLEGAARWNILPENIRLEGGFAYLRLGEFPKRAPNGLPDAANPIYVYVQVSFRI